MDQMSAKAALQETADAAVAAADALKSAPFFQVPFYYLRHGESTYNLAGRIAGSVDPELTELGRSQAEDAADVLQSHGIRTIHASAAQRASATAEPLARRLGLPVHRHASLWERNWGVMEGEPLALLTDRSITADGGESLVDFNLRIMRALAGLPGDRPILVVGHSGTLRVLRIVLGTGDIPPSIGNALPIRVEPPAAPGGAWSLIELS